MSDAAKAPTLSPTELAQAFLGDKGLQRIMRMNDDELFDYVQQHTDGHDDVEPPVTYEQLLFVVAKFLSRQKLRAGGFLD